MQERRHVVLGLAGLECAAERRNAGIDGLVQGALFPRAKERFLLTQRLRSQRGQRACGRIDDGVELRLSRRYRSRLLS